MSTVTDPTPSNIRCTECGDTAKNRSCNTCGGGVPEPGRDACQNCLLGPGEVPAITPPSPGPTAPPVMKTMNLPKHDSGESAGEWHGIPIDDV